MMMFILACFRPEIPFLQKFIAMIKLFKVFVEVVYFDFVQSLFWQIGQNS